MPELKYLIFFSVLAVGVPGAYFLAMRNSHIEKFIFFLTVFFTCSLNDINFLSHEHYRGTSRGFEVSLVDLAVLTIFLIVIARRNWLRITIFPPGSTLYFIYFFFSVVSVINSGIVLYSFFEIWKMIRMYFYFWVLYNYIRDYSRIKLLMKYIVIVMVYIFLVAVYQKYCLGIYQIPGPFPHQNSLVMYMIVFTALIFSSLLNEKRNLRKMMPVCLIFGMGCIVIISTLSRAGIVCFVLSSAIVLAVSLATELNIKKIALTILMAFMAGLVLLKASDTIIRRYRDAPEESKTTRIHLAKAACNMANNRILGVGLNNFGLKINPPYPYGKSIERSKWNEREGLVETAYLMIAAETGWHNLIIFFAFIIYFYILNIINFFRYKGHPLRYICIGLMGGLSGIYLESTIEWVLKQTNNFYQLMLIFAIIGIMARRSLTVIEKYDDCAT
jgi:O-antigen ligase/polysaccharide polymerase Wzy-like membrane protein